MFFYQNQVTSSASENISARIHETYLLKKSSQSGRNQPLQFHVNEQKNSALLKQKNEKVHKSIFCWNNIFIADDKMYTISQNSKFQKSSPLS